MQNPHQIKTMKKQKMILLALSPLFGATPVYADAILS
jgi:hypothetical protein